MAGVFVPSMITFAGTNKQKIGQLLAALPDPDGKFPTTFHGTGTGAVQGIPGFLDQIPHVALEQLRQLLTDLQTSVADV